MAKPGNHPIQMAKQLDVVMNERAQQRMMLKLDAHQRAVAATTEFNENGSTAKLASPEEQMEYAKELYEWVVDDSVSEVGGSLAAAD